MGLHLNVTSCCMDRQLCCRHGLQCSVCESSEARKKTCKAKIMSQYILQMHAICTADPMHPAAHLSILFAALRLICNQLHSVLRLSPGPAGRDSSLSHCRLSIVAAARSASAHMRLQLSPATSSLLEICRAACCALLHWERLRGQAV